jgi:peroxiredoxin Q/BCP
MTTPAAPASPARPAPPARPVRVGDALPDFVRTDHAGATIDTAALRAQGRWIVLFFYPSDFTPACTAQSCAFRDSYGELLSRGAAVIGVSGNGESSHARFAGAMALPYPLLSDADGSLRALLGVPRSLLGLFPGRVTYVADPGGTVRLVFSSQLRAKEHARRALHTLRPSVTPPA